MSATCPTNAEVFKIFETWRQHLIEIGFSQSQNVYYLHGEYDLGPVVTKTGENVRLFKEHELNGRKFWSLDFDISSAEYLWNVYGTNWRLYHFVLDVDAHAFFTNKEAYDWFANELAKAAVSC